MQSRALKPRRGLKHLGCPLVLEKIILRFRDSATYPGPTVNNGKAGSKILVSWKAFPNNINVIITIAPRC